MPRSSHIAVALSALALAFPGAAFAQGSAGGDNYQDPFGSQNGGHGGSNPGGSSSGNPGSSSSSGNSSSSSNGSGSPTPTTASTGSSGANGSSSGSAAAGSRGHLPRTGLDASIIAFVGALLLASGIGLRRRVPAFWR